MLEMGMKATCIYYTSMHNILFIYFYRGGGRGKHRSVAPHTHHDWDRTCNPGVCPNEESNQ